MDDWAAFFTSVDLKLFHREVFRKEMDFDEWAARMGVGGDDLSRLRVLMLQGPEEVQAYYRPRQVGNRLLFDIAEGIIVSII